MAKKSFRKKPKTKTIVWSIVAVLLSAAIGVGIYYLVTYKTGNKNDADETKDNIEQTQDDVDTVETQEEALALQLVG